MTDSSPEYGDGGEAAFNTQTSSASAGSLLLAARESAGLSRAELSQRLCIIDNTVEWIETDDYARQPEAVYTRGYIRNICRELNIPTEPVLAAYDRDRPQPVQRNESRRVIKAEAFRPERKRGYGALALLPLLLAGGVFWWMYGVPVNMPGMPLSGDSAELVAAASTASEAAGSPVAEVEQQEITVAQLSSEPLTPAASVTTEVDPEAVSTEEVSTEAPVAEAVATAVAEIEPAATETPQLDQPQQGALRLRFDEDAWVEVKDAAGVVLLAGVQAAGSTKTLDGPAPFDLMLGNARATHVVYRDEIIDTQPLGDRRTRRLTVGD
ncbi:helix-turn-helix domain-containing protein [Microbulbifer sp. SSSA002]|uniref:helix-turn-helix domain-containing protein n=1 Tax=Microbulbifer sp. SSSA002 TaxID=3243376 RepID=UPI004039E139